MGTIANQERIGYMFKATEPQTKVPLIWLESKLTCSQDKAPRVQGSTMQRPWN